MSRLMTMILWAHARRRTINAWVIRAVSFYFGYKILNHEIYEAKGADPLLIFLGLWLCGIAPATFFDGVRKVGVGVTSALESEASGVPPGPTTELPSPSEPTNDKSEREHQ